jgi:Cupin-like domain
MSIVGQIDRIKNITLAEFKARYRHNKPVVLEGAAREWAARSVLTPENLKNMFGDVTVNCRETDDEIDMYFGDDSFGATRRTYLKFKDYIDLICGKDSFEERPPYLANVDFDMPEGSQYLQQLKSLLDFPDFFQDINTGKTFTLWIGAPGQKSTIHNHNYHTLITQIYGTKSCLLYSPDQHDALHATYVNPTCWGSPVDPQQPDLEKFPRFKEAGALETVLDAGDILYVPLFWFHHVFAHTVSINTNQFINVGVAKSWNEEQLNWRNPELVTA